jgi:hypothetical protein
MKCLEIRQLLIPYLDSELSESERVIVEAHLHACADCQKEKMLLEKTWAALDAFQAPAVSGSFTGNLMAKIHGHEEPALRPAVAKPGMSLRFAFRVLAPALVSVCVVIVVYLFVQNELALKRQPANEATSLQRPGMQAVKETPAIKSIYIEATLAKQEEGIEPAATAPAKVEKPEISAADMEIIRNLDVYKNMELYQNFELLNDLDVVENMGAKGV